jgi:AraC-like DNA-binding protein
MIPYLLKILNRADNSFSYTEFTLPNINSKWHYHPEIELIQIHEGSGTQFMGDNIKHFKAGDIVLVGSNLPHFWRYDEVADATSTDHHYSTVIHFTEKLWGENFLEMPENVQLNDLINKAKRGLLIQGETRDRVSKLIKQIGQVKGTYRLIHLLECLAIIADSQEFLYLSSLGFQYNASTVENERINAIYEYCFTHYLEKIPLDKIASEVGLVPSSFCRYFKSKTGKNFTKFILELKIGHACKMLMESDSSIKKICYDSGFNNFVSFHKHFKSITGMSPQNYQKLHGGNEHS